MIKQEYETKALDLEDVEVKEESDTSEEETDE